MGPNNSKIADFPRDLYEKIALPKPEFIYRSSLSLKENEDVYLNHVDEWIRIYIKEEGYIYRIHKKILELPDNSVWHTVIEEECADKNISESFAILLLRYYPEYYDVPVYN